MKQMLLLSLFLSLLSGCSNTSLSGAKQTSATAQTVTDIEGHEIPIDQPARRIVCLFDPSIDILYMLGAQDQLVGVPVEMYLDSELYDYYRLIDPRIERKELPTPGSNELANLESIIELEPDLVIAQLLSPSALVTLQSMGIPVYIASASRYEDVMKEMKDISLLVGKPERGEELIAYAKEKMAELQERLSNDENPPRKSVYFTWANGRIYTTTGRNSMMNDCLVLAGVENACASEVDAPNINPETLLEWDPDMIVMWNDSPDLFYNRQELAPVKAIRHRAIYNLMPMFFYNPHTFKAICAALAIHHWAYGYGEKLNNEEIEEVIRRLYGEENGTKLIARLP